MFLSFPHNTTRRRLSGVSFDYGFERNGFEFTLAGQRISSRVWTSKFGSNWTFSISNRLEDHNPLNTSILCWGTAVPDEVGLTESFAHNPKALEIQESSQSHVCPMRTKYRFSSGEGRLGRKAQGWFCNSNTITVAGNQLSMRTPKIVYVSAVVNEFSTKHKHVLLIKLLLIYTTESRTLCIHKLHPSAHLCPYMLPIHNALIIPIHSPHETLLPRLKEKQHTQSTQPIITHPLPRLPHPMHRRHKPSAGYPRHQAPIFTTIEPGIYGAATHRPEPSRTSSPPVAS